MRKLASQLMTSSVRQVASFAANIPHYSNLRAGLHIKALQTVQHCWYGAATGPSQLRRVRDGPWGTNTLNNHWTYKGAKLCFMIDASGSHQCLTNGSFFSKEKAYFLCFSTITLVTPCKRFENVQVDIWGICTSKQSCVWSCVTLL